MTKLYEIKDRIFQFYSKYETYLAYVWKFVIALSLFGIISGKIGFMEDINHPMIILVLATICCALPIGFSLLVAGVLILLHLYVLSAEVALITALVFAVVLFLYFRFALRDIVLFAATPILCTLGVPYVLPIITGLLRRGHSYISVVAGMVVYYFLEGIYKNVSTLQAVIAGGVFDGSKMSITAGTLFENKEFYLILTVFTMSTFVIYTIRKMAIKNAWKIAIAAGIIIQITGLLVGYIWFNITEKVLGMLLGNIFAAMVGFVIEFLFMNLDYSRTERVQFEDDEYYYFVKAVPKKMIASSEKTVTEFSGFSEFTHKMRVKKEAEEKVTRKNIADELDIDEDLLN